MVGAPAVKSAARVLDLLELLAHDPSGLHLGDVCKLLDWPKSSAHGLVRTLTDRGYVRVDAGGGYRLGARAFEVGQAYLGGTDLVEDGTEFARSLSSQTGETVHLAVLDGADALYVAKCEGTHTIRMASAVGKRLPAYATGVGKVLLAGLTDRELDLLYPPGDALPRLTATTLADSSALRAELRRIRERGHALDWQESTVGLGCVAFPVYDAAGLAAALSVSVPVDRFEGARDLLIDRTGSAASALSRRLGGGPSAARAPASARSTAPDLPYPSSKQERT